MKKLLYLIILFCLTGCGFFTGKLKDQDVENYIKAQRKLNEWGLKAEDSIHSNADVKKIEAIIKEAGFKDMLQFMQVVTKIGTAMSLSQGSSFMDQLDDATKEQLKQIETALADPGTPAETKEELEKSRTAILKEWEKNNANAKPVMDFTKSLVDENTRAVVKKYEKELLQVFQDVK